MSLTIASCLTMLVIIAFFTTKRFLHPFEQLLIFFLLVFGYTSFVSIVYVNLGLWELSQRVQDVVAFRLNGLVYVPLTILWFIGLWRGAARNFFRYGVLLGCFLILLYSGDYLLRLYGVYQYHEWNHMILGTAWISLFAITLLVQHFFRLLLKKERILL
ncbi:hypothetical protein [Bacillus benzoevorans]|uniref:Uncharacterized protein n=1 Tax=Bacillus benzoevorans TaxID=1456 RepID=A0A7X0LX21_9BACI|nr:hypothetical protein [Bacillus benzoevorans]MBB6446067.1 hypothetical protein [Bacillus benzoevorans]